jgi:DNA-directed RNA polymerase alpha subunit
MYKTVGDITKHTQNELMIVRNMGRKSLEEILEFIRVNGFVLPDKEDE